MKQNKLFKKMNFEFLTGLIWEEYFSRVQKSGRDVRPRRRRMNPEVALLGHRQMDLARFNLKKTWRYIVLVNLNYNTFTISLNFNFEKNQLKWIVRNRTNILVKYETIFMEILKRYFITNRFLTPLKRSRPWECRWRRRFHRDRRRRSSSRWWRLLWCSRSHSLPSMTGSFNWKESLKSFFLL